MHRFSIFTSMRRLPVFGWMTFLFLLTNVASAQDYFGYSAGRYSRVDQTIVNPAISHSGLSKIDFNLTSFEFGFNNSLFFLDRNALDYPKLPSSWQNKTPNVPDNVYKNFSIQPGNATSALTLEQRRLLPSVSLRIDPHQSIAFICSYRQFGNIDGINSALSGLIQKEFDLSVLQNKAFTIQNLNIIKMNWLEYGFNYSRTFHFSQRHHISTGITLKLLQGLESAYFTGRQLGYLFSTVDTTSYLQADFSFARSQAASVALDFRGRFQSTLPHAAPLQPGFDVGFLYELTERRSALKKDTLLHKLKLGVSLVDAGRIRFLKQRDYYDLNVFVTQSDVMRYLALGNSRQVDSLIRKDFPANTGSAQFTVLTPLALNLQSDYHVAGFYFVNLSAHFTGFNRNNLMRVHSTTAICLSPRYERYWFEVAVPLTYNSMSAQLGQWVLPGLSLRAGPLRIGTNDLTGLVRKNLSGLHFYAQLQATLPYPRKARLSRWK